MSTFKYDSPNGLPCFIPKGGNKTFEISWFESGVFIGVGISSAFFTLKQGSRVIVDRAVATTIGGATTATYDLVGTVTSELSLGDDFLIIWEINATYLGNPVVHKVRRAAHLVLTLLYPMVLASDLYSRHQRLVDIKPPGIPDWTSYIDSAWEILNRDLIKKGRRPELILDSYALYDMHVYKSLELIFRDAITFVGDGRYNDLAGMYASQYIDEWDKVQFHYDRNENDAVDEEQEASSPAIWLNEPPPGHPSTIVINSEFDI
jgi:hypothetical protein